MLIQVHDEIIGECPIENAKQAAERFCYIMAHSVEDKIDIPFNTDAVFETHWASGAVEDTSAEDIADYIEDFEDEDE
jgi:DNA polymerase I-like protein with 3'-5' exonuclease and polymerase domains